MFIILGVIVYILSALVKLGPQAKITKESTMRRRDEARAGEKYCEGEAATTCNGYNVIMTTTKY
jgi:hypothetical protein